MTVLGKFPCKLAQNREITKNRTDANCRLRRMAQLGIHGKAGAASGEVPDSKAFEFAREFKPKRVRQNFKEFSGEPCRIRTCDPLIKSQLLYQLS